MSIDHFEFFVEEESMEIFLQTLIPKLIGNILYGIYPFQGKRELLALLPDRLRGYARMNEQNGCVIVIIDRDNKDCKTLKADLEKIALDAGLITKSSQGTNSRFQVINRIAIEELEAWYFGDWSAVISAYPEVPPSIPTNSKYSNPDAIQGGTEEALEKIFRKAGYHKSGLRKREAAREIVPHIIPSRNTSKSFQVFRDAIQQLVASPNE